MSAQLAGTTPIEADNAPFSDYESDAGSELSTQSLTSSIRAHVYENGRRYHLKSAHKNYMPTDETEQERLDLAHHIFSMIRGGAIYMAPISHGGDPANVLDAGTGIGIWALDFGNLHPGSQVIGLDLVPIQPSWTYPNVKFECDDLEKDWTYKPDFFQYIHSRTLATSIRDWPRYLGQCFKHTAPGGYIEVVEAMVGELLCDDDTYDGTPLQKYIEKFRECLVKSGVPVNINGEYIKQCVEGAGYKDVYIEVTRVPWGPWPKSPLAKHIGATNQLNLETGLEAYALGVFTAFGEMTEENAKKLIADAFKDIASRRVHAYSYVWNVIGKKPETPSE